MKRFQFILILLTLTILPGTISHAWDAFRNEDGRHNANIVTSQTPTDAANTHIKWQKQFSDAVGTAYNSSPIITGNHLYVVCENTLYELDKEGEIKRSFSLCNSMNSVCRMALHENQLFIPLKNGTMQCVDITTMTSQWVSEGFSNQSLTTTLYYDGYVYAGTTNANGSDGLYYCLDTQQGSTIWTYKNTDNSCGYYWSGACIFDTGEKKGLLLGGDNGILVSHSLTNETQYDCFDLSSLTPSIGKIRAGITYDEYTDCYYTTTNNGYLYRIKLQSDGTFDTITPLFLGDSSTDTINCTSTPTICNGRIYVGSFYQTSGRLLVVNAATMTRIYSASGLSCGDIKASPLLSTGYASSENTGKVFVYITHNAFPGGLYYMEDTPTTTHSELKPLITPNEGKQFCMSSVAADTDGTLYYSNDSGYLFAIAIGSPAVPSPSSVPEVPTTTAPPDKVDNPALSTSPTPTGTTLKQNKTKKKVGKPQNIRYQIKKKKSGIFQITLSWKKGKNAKKTYVQIAKNQKRYCKKNTLSFTRKRGRCVITMTSCGKNGTQSKRVKKVILIR